MDTPASYYDLDTGALRVGNLQTVDTAVLREASRWSTGERGEPVPLADLDGVDLTLFAREALSVGARVLPVMMTESALLSTVRWLVTGSTIGRMKTPRIQRRSSRWHRTGSDPRWMSRRRIMNPAMLVP